MDFSLHPFWSASIAIQIHIVFALMAAVSGAFVFFRRKGTKLHRLIGRYWFVFMFVVSVSSLFINQIRTWGPFSPLHLFAISTFATLGYALWAVRTGRIEAHQYALKGLYLGGIVFAGALTFSRGLIMHQIVFGKDGGTFMPLPGELPGGPVGAAFLGAFLVFIVLIMSAGRSQIQNEKD